MADTDRLLVAARRLIRATSEAEIRYTAVTLLDQFTGADQSTAIPIEKSTEANHVWAGTGSLDVPEQRPLLSGIIGQVYTTEDPWVIDDLTDTRGVSTQSTPGSPKRYESLLAVPVDDWGVLAAVARDRAAFTDEDREAVELLASCVAAAFDRISTSPTQQIEDDLLEEVANILSHDVRNPLMVIDGQLQLAREEADLSHLNQVATSLDRIKELIDDIVVLARTGQRVETIEEVELREIAEQAWTVVDTADAELAVRGSATLTADRSTICQLLENLFRNAVEHGGSDVTVRVGLLEEADGFYVEDTGVGIPPDERDHVLEYGYSSIDEQTGFGLGIVAKVVDSHGWDIRITESQVGGARFEITGVNGSDSSIST